MAGSKICRRCARWGRLEDAPSWLRETARLGLCDLDQRPRTGESWCPTEFEALEQADTDPAPGSGPEEIGLGVRRRNNLITTTEDEDDG